MTGLEIPAAIAREVAPMPRLDECIARYKALTGELIITESIPAAVVIAAMSQFLADVIEVALPPEKRGPYWRGIADIVERQR